MWARNSDLACVAFFSMEMSRESVVNRLISSEADVDSHRLRLDQLSAAEEKRVGEAVGILSETPFYIDDSPQLRVVEMRSKVRRLHNERGVDMVVLDYLQLVHGDTRNDNRVQEVSEISRALKALARELQRLIEDPARREALGQAAQAEAKAYDWPAVTLRLVETLQPVEAKSAGDRR